ncbi:hypothetical protein ABNQ39_14150 [Azospirillum sp. A26]|uniref:hypothetical protein n=1 Tax=Azospirillum sp. A26 TaxID=3160607 RepID=UPI00366C1930
MNKRFLLYLVITIGSAAILAAFVSVPDLKKVSTVIMALFGALTGFLVNLMMRTAQALEGQGLKASELIEISELLRVQQKGWRKLFYLYILVIISILSISLSPDIWEVTIRNVKINFSMVGPTIFGTILAVALLRSLSMLTGIEALQELRSSLLIGAAKRKEQEAREKALSEITYKPGPTNPSYGRTIPFPGANPPAG